MPYGGAFWNPPANDNQGNFAGHIRDNATGLNYMQARYYDLLIGRFLSTDPVGFLSTGEPAQFNRYAYAYNDPVNLVDPDGNRPSRARGTTYRGIAGEQRYQTYTKSAYEIGLWTRIPQAHSRTFTPSISQVNSMNLRRKIERRKALNQGQMTGQVNYKKGLTKMGHAYQKHSAPNQLKRTSDPTFARNGRSTPVQYNARALQVYNNIANRAYTVTHNPRKNTFDLRTKSGSGIRIERDGNGGFRFKTFLNNSNWRSPRATRLK